VAAHAVPTIDAFKAQFPEDFPYGLGSGAVTPADVQLALNLVASGAYFNPALFQTEPLAALSSTASVPAPTEQSMAFLYCAAHFLYLNVKTRGGLKAPGFRGGLSSGPQGVLSNKSVGGVSVSYEWPEGVKDDPMLFQFTRSPYGEMYLQLLVPKLVGNIGLVAGERLPTGFSS
jgi:Protein of unknown function (DUF4054)